MRLRSMGGILGAGLCSWMLIVGVLGTFSAIHAWQPTTAAAQELDKVPGDEPAARPEAAPGVTTSAVAKKSWLRWLWDSLGVMYSIIFLIISFVLVAVVVMIVMHIRQDRIVPPALVQLFESHLDAKRYQEAYDVAKGHDSVLGRVLAGGLSRISDGYDAAKGAMEEVGEDEAMKLEHELGFVALIAQIGPMFGLLGTVDGMVQAFEVIASKNQTPKPSELAQGIGTALVTTVVGLWIAIPSIAFFTIYRAKLARLVLELGQISEGLMSRFSKVGQKKS